MVRTLRRTTTELVLFGWWIILSTAKALCKCVLCLHTVNSIRHIYHVGLLRRCKVRDNISSLADSMWWPSSSPSLEVEEHCRELLCLIYQGWTTAFGYSDIVCWLADFISPCQTNKHDNLNAKMRFIDCGHFLFSSQKK